MNLWDHTDIKKSAWRPQEGTYSWISDAECSGSVAEAGERPALDYHHVSSVSVGPSGRILVALRNINVVFCFEISHSANETVPATTNLVWTLASTDDLSDFSWSRDVDRFYSPHSVAELDDGKIVMIDDGSGRSGCTQSNDYAGCWSRAAM